MGAVVDSNGMRVCCGVCKHAVTLAIADRLVCIALRELCSAHEELQMANHLRWRRIIASSMQSVCNGLPQRCCHYQPLHEYAAAYSARLQ
jgi:hypothetical protein